MRIIGGTSRGLRLRTLGGAKLRPTTDHMRETIFDVLGPRIEGSTFLDAYAGSGAVGIEAISRGARDVTFIEHHRPAAQLIRENLKSLGIESGYVVLASSVIKGLERLEATRSTLREAARAHDLILTCGGVSVGEEDHVKSAVEAEGHLSMWQIAMKPGKPLAFGAVRRAGVGQVGEMGAATAAEAGSGAGSESEAFFIGLPGNPVSTFVTFLLFARPFALRLMGVRTVTPRALSLRADFAQSKADRRNEFLRARINPAGGLDLFPNQSSAVLTSTVWGDGLIDNPPNHVVSAGETVRFIPFSELLN